MAAADTSSERVRWRFAGIPNSKNGYTEALGAQAVVDVEAAGEAPQLLL